MVNEKLCSIGSVPFQWKKLPTVWSSILAGSPENGGLLRYWNIQSLPHTSTELGSCTVDGVTILQSTISCTRYYSNKYPVTNIHNMTCMFRYSQITGLVSWVDPLTRCSCQRDARPCITTTQLGELCFRSEIVWLSLVYYSTLSLSVDVDTDNQYKEPMVNSNII